MWSCATTDTGHAQRSYLTVAQLLVASWRSTLSLRGLNGIDFEQTTYDEYQVLP